MIKLGTVKERKLNSRGKKIVVHYANVDVVFDPDGWADAKKFMPRDYELCQVKIKEKPNQLGWPNGLKWDGLKIQRTDEIEYWKKHNEYGV